jgi:ABC-2 type transport system permease protein
LNTIKIVRKELLIQLRNKQTFLFMIAFPIVLILILGTALSGAFSSNTKVDDLKLLYRSSIHSPQLEASWEQFTAELKQQGVQLTSATVGTDGQKEVQEDHYTGYAELSDSGIRYYGSSQQQIENNIVTGMLSVYSDRYNLMASALKADPASVQTIAGAADSFGDSIKVTSLTKEKQPGSIDYYAIAMSTMIAFYSCMSSINLIPGERIRKTAIRLSASPVGKGEIFAGKVISATLINFICVVVVVLFSGLVFKADWGSHYVAIGLVLLTEVALAVSFGLLCGYLFKNGTGRPFVVIVIQIFSFIGGAYFPVGDSSGFMGKIILLSPLRWANDALHQVIYADQASAALPAILLNLAFVTAFLALSAIYMRRQEAL